MSVSPLVSPTDGPPISPPHSYSDRMSVSSPLSLTGGPTTSPPHSLSVARPSHTLSIGASVSPPHSQTGRLSAHSHSHRPSASTLPGISSAYPLSGRAQRLPECSQNTAISSTSLPAMAQGSARGTATSPTSIPDPLSLPLSMYLSLPLSNLVQALNQGLSPQIPAPTVAPIPVVSSLAMPTRPPAQPATSRTSSQYPRPSHTSTSTASAGNWSSNLEPIDVEPFVEEVGPTVEIPQIPAEAFQLYFTGDMCTYIVEQTNLYAQQVMGSGFTTWDKITEEELRAYFGFQIYMGIVNEPATEDYWRRDELHFGPIADRISRKRFRDINRSLHFSDNTTLVPRGQPGYDRLGKVRPIMDRVQEKLTGLYKPHRENAMDEAMIKFQGRSSIKQYMPAKPVKRGIKVWCRADSHNGYICEFQVYTGKSDETEGGLGKRVILDLSQTLEGKNHHLYFDNFFTSVDLLQTLRDKGVYACGTVRQTSRGFPPALKLNGKGKRELERHGLLQR